MKKLILCLVMLTLILSFGVASASEQKIPQHVQDAYTAQFGTKATFGIWFPVYPELPASSWTNFLVLSNYYSSAISVSCMITNLSNKQITQTFQLGKFEKVINSRLDLGLAGNDVYDILCVSDNFFGAAALLLEGSAVAVAWPPILLY